jgi:hypothetical protein
MIRTFCVACASIERKTGHVHGIVTEAGAIGVNGLARRPTKERNEEMSFINSIKKLFGRGEQAATQARGAAADSASTAGSMSGRLGDAAERTKESMATAGRSAAASMSESAEAMGQRMAAAADKAQDVAADAARTAASKVSAAADSVADTMGAAAERAKEAVASAGDEAKEMADEAKAKADDAGDKASTS